jgi:hypothetical protein
MKYECSECARTLFNRRLANCEFCGATIPQALRLSDSDKKQLENAHQKSMRRKSEIEQPFRQYDPRGEDKIELGITIMDIDISSFSE